MARVRRAEYEYQPPIAEAVLLAVARLDKAAARRRPASVSWRLRENRKTRLRSSKAN
jgi:hypothetical protein